MGKNKFVINNLGQIVNALKLTDFTYMAHVVQASAKTGWKQTICNESSFRQKNKIITSLGKLIIIIIIQQN